VRLRLVLHPRGECLVEPDVIPPRGGDEVSEPLMCDLVRDDPKDPLLLLWG
jgi:hypothetical protein